MAYVCAPVTVLPVLGPVIPAAGPALDPYLVWAESTAWKGFYNLPQFDAQALIPVIAEADPQVDIATLVQAGQVEIAAPYLEQLKTARPYRSPYFTALVARAALPAFRAGVARFHIAVPPVSAAAFGTTIPGSQNWLLRMGRFLPGFALLKAVGLAASLWPRLARLAARRPAAPLAPPPPPPAPASAPAQAPVASAAVRPTIAVIDDGCAIYNPAFGDPAAPTVKTRIRSLWSQGRNVARGDWQPETRFGYGRTLGAASIDAKLALIDGDAGRAMQAYEDDRYLVARTSPQLVEWTHGTAVLDLAAGNAARYRLQDEGLPPADCDIRFVHLPSIQSEDMSGGGLPVFLLDGIRHVLDELDPDAPVVVNVSYGALAGPHDGSSLIERALDDLLAHRPNLAIVLAAGNAREAKCHWQHELAPGDSKVLTWTLEDDDPTDSFVELWMPAGARLGMRLQPDNQPAQALAPESVLLWTDQGDPVGMAFRSERNPRGDGQSVLLAVTPTNPPNDGQSATAGRWTISITNDGAVPVTVDAFVERDATAPWALVQVPWQSTVGGSTTAGTLSNLASGARTIVVGGSIVKPPGMAPTSSKGPSRRAARAGPDVAAASEIRPEVGLQCTGVLPGSIALDDDGRFTGTSAAAPLVSRWLADYMAFKGACANSPLTWDQLQAAVRGPGTVCDPASGYRIMKPPAGAT